MKTVRIHPFSVLFGILGGALLLTIVGFRAQAATDTPDRAMAVYMAPFPADHVRIMEGEPFEVPAGRALTLKLLTLTGMSPPGGAVMVNIDGVAVYSLDPMFGGSNEIPFGVTAFSGEVVTVGQQFPQPGSTAVGFGFLSGR